MALPVKLRDAVNHFSRFVYARFRASLTVIPVTAKRTLSCQAKGLQIRINAEAYDYFMSGSPLRYFVVGFLELLFIKTQNFLCLTIWNSSLSMLSINIYEMHLRQDVIAEVCLL